MSQAQRSGIPNLPAVAHESSALRRAVAKLDEWAFLLHLASLGIAAAFLLRVNRDQWFYADEWAFLTYTRDALPWWDEFLIPHNGHLSVVPLLEYQTLRGVFGLHSYWPFIAVLVVAHLLATHLLWRVTVSVGVDRLVATGLGAAFAVVGAGWENLLWAFQTGFVGALAFGLGATLLANDVNSSRRRIAGAVVATAMSLLCSGVGIVMCGVVVLVGLMRGGIQRAIALGAIPTALWLAWRVAWPTGLYPEPPYGPSSVREFADGVGPYVVSGLFGSMDRFLFDLPGLGALATVLLAIFAVRNAGRLPDEAVAAYALAAGAVFFLVLTASTRLKLGVDQGASARYSYVVLALLMPLAGVALTRITKRRAGATLAVSSLAIALAVHNAQLLREAASRESAGKALLRESVLAGAAIVRDPRQPILPDAVPEPVFSGALSMDDLRRFASNGDLPSLNGVSIASQLTAAARTQVALRRHDPAQEERTACNTVPVGEAARLEANSRSASAVLIADGPTSVHVLLSDALTGASGAPRALSLDRGAWDLVVLRPDAIAFIGPQDRAIRTCRGAATG